MSSSIVKHVLALNDIQARLIFKESKATRSFLFFLLSPLLLAPSILNGEEADARGGMCGSAAREECRNDQIEFIFLLSAAAMKTVYYQHVQKVVQTGNMAFKAGPVTHTSAPQTVFSS